jgi:hypothetical protein
MDGRLKRQQINSASIPASVDTLLDPEVPLALRLSGQLLLGVVRIYARKVSVGIMGQPHMLSLDLSTAASMPHKVVCVKMVPVLACAAGMLPRPSTYHQAAVGRQLTPVYACTVAFLPTIHITETQQQ